MRVRRILLALAFSYVALTIAVGILVAEFSLHVQRLPASGSYAAYMSGASNHSKPEPVQIMAQDGAVLHAWYVQPATWNGDTALLLHGVGDNRHGMTGYGALLLAHGYSVLLPDSRAHGESGGTLVTYGLKEREDVRRWVDWLYAGIRPGCVYGLGESMGAGVVLQSLEEGTDFCAVVAESPFATFRQAAYDREGLFFHLGPWFGRTLGRPSIEFGLLYARLRYGLNLASASPATALRHSSVPVLLIHGTSDENILPRHSELLHQVDVAHSQLWLVPQAMHTGAYATAPTEFESRVLGWFAIHHNRRLSAPVLSHN